MSKKAGNALMPIFAAIACALVVGCGDTSVTPNPEAPTAAKPTSDETVLLSLDCYEPMYKVNADGRITHLRLSGRHLPTQIMGEIGKLTELEKLDCYGASVTDDSLLQLKDLQKLRNLGLGASTVTDKGLVHLEQLQSLQWLWLPRGKVSHAGVDKLKAARPDMNVYLQ